MYHPFSICRRMLLLVLLLQSLQITSIPAFAGYIEPGNITFGFSEITSNSATINAVVKCYSSPTHIRIYYRKVGQYSTGTSRAPIIGENRETVHYNFPITSLECGCEYEVEVELFDTYGFHKNTKKATFKTLTCGNPCVAPTEKPNLTSGKPWQYNVGEAIIPLRWDNWVFGSSVEVQELLSGSWTTVIEYGGGNGKNVFKKSNGTYTYRARFRNNCGSGNWSDTVTVTVDILDGCKRPTFVPVLTSTAGAPDTDGRYAINWTSQSGLTYELEESSNGGWNVVFSGNGSSASFNKGNGTYKYRIKAINDCGDGPVSEVKTVTVQIPTCSKPSHVNLQVSSSSDGMIRGTYSGGSGAAYFKLYVNGRSQGVISGGKFNYSPPGSGQYQIKVRAYNSCGSTTSYTRLITVCRPVGTPVLTVPEKSSTGSYTVSWNQVPGADSYNLFENGVQIYSGANVSFQVSKRASGTYEYMVQAVGCTTQESAIVKIVVDTAEEKGVITGVSGGLDIDDDGTPDNYYPQPPNFTKGWVSEVSVKNTGSKPGSYTVQCVGSSRIVNGWVIGAQDGGVSALLDDTYDGDSLKDIPPGETRTATFLVQSKKGAVTPFTPKFILKSVAVLGLCQKVCDTAQPEFTTGSLPDGSPMVKIEDVTGGRGSAIGRSGNKYLYFNQDKEYILAVNIRNNGTGLENYDVIIGESAGWSFQAVHGSDNRAYVRNLGAGQTGKALFRLKYTGAEDSRNSKDVLLWPRITVRYSYQASCVLATAGGVAFVVDKTPSAQVYIADAPDVCRIGVPGKDNTYTLQDIGFGAIDKLGDDIVNKDCFKFDVEVKPKGAGALDWVSVMENESETLIDLPSLKIGEPYMLRVSAIDPAGLVASTSTELNVIPTLSHDPKNDLVPRPGNDHRFDIYATYRDLDGDLAETSFGKPILLVVNGNEHVMALEGGDPVHGARYAAKGITVTTDGAYFFIYSDKRGAPLQRFPALDRRPLTRHSGHAVKTHCYWGGSGYDTRMRNTNISMSVKKIDNGSIVTFIGHGTVYGTEKEVRQALLDINANSYFIFQNLNKSRLALLGSDGGTFKIFNLNTVSDARATATIELQFPIIDIAVEGNTAYAVLDSGEIVAIDVADPNAPRKLARMSFPDAVCVAVEGNTMVVATDSGLDLYDVSQSDMPKKIGTVEGVVAEELCMANGLVYAAHKNRLRVFDISDPQRPAKNPNRYFPCGVDKLWVEGDRLLTSLKDGTVYSLDLATPNASSLLDPLPTGPDDLKIDAVDQLVLTDSLITMRSSSAVCFGSVNTAGNLKTTELVLPGSMDKPFAHAVEGDTLALVTRNDQGLTLGIYQLGMGGTQALLLKTLSLEGKQATCVAMGGGVVYVSLGSKILPVFTGGEDALLALPSIMPSAPVRAMDIRGTRLVVVEDGGEVEVFDISMPAFGGAKLATIHLPGVLHSVAVSGGRVFAGGESESGEGKIWRLNLEQDLTLEKTVTLPAPAEALQVYGGLLLVAAGNKGLLVFDQEDFEVAGSMDVPGFAKTIGTYQDMIYVGLGNAGLISMKLEGAPVAKDGMLTTNKGVAKTGTLRAMNLDGGALTFMVVREPSHGTVSLLDPRLGTYRYIPNSGYTGEDSFAFKVNDSKKDSNIAQVSIRIGYPGLDTDKDGVNDDADPDDDNDGVPDIEDLFPLDPEEFADNDGDGIGDNADWDDDNDGIWDSEDPFPKGKTNDIEAVLSLLLFSGTNPSPEQNNANSYGFKVTKNPHPENADWDQIVKDEFGQKYRVADWNDFKAFYRNGGSLSELLDKIGLAGYGDSGAVYVNGSKKYSSSRWYFLSRHNHHVPVNYMVHQNIDNYMLSLGSWSGERKIIAYEESY